MRSDFSEYLDDVFLRRVIGLENDTTQELQAARVLLVAMSNDFLARRNAEVLVLPVCHPGNPFGVFFVRRDYVEQCGQLFLFEEILARLKTAIIGGSDVLTANMILEDLQRLGAQVAVQFGVEFSRFNGETTEDEDSVYRVEGNIFAYELGDIRDAEDALDALHDFLRDLDVEDMVSTTVSISLADGWRAFSEELQNADT